MSAIVFFMLLILFAIMFIIGLYVVDSASTDGELMRCIIGWGIIIVASICCIALCISQVHTCKRCGTINIGKYYCTKCGANIYEDGHQKCVVCGKRVHYADEFCGNCGTKLKES